MIVDTLEHFTQYVAVHPLFAQARQWLCDTDLTALAPNQKIIIDGENLFAKTEEYMSVCSYERTFEGHRKYIDIQVIIEGAEAMEVATLKGNEPIDIPYDETAEIYKVKTQEEAKILLKASYFAIFFPQDLHKPCLNYASKSELVKKVTLKVLCAA